MRQTKIGLFRQLCKPSGMRAPAGTEHAFLDSYARSEHIALMRIVLLAMLAAILPAGCTSSGDTSGGGRDSTAAVRRLPPPNQIQSNLSTIEAVIDSVAPSEKIGFRVGFLVRSADSQENGFAAQGEHVTAVPQFILKDDGSIDSAEAKNTHLFALRTMKQGDVVHCTVFLDSKGEWHILDVLK